MENLYMSASTSLANDSTIGVLLRQPFISSETWTIIHYFMRYSLLPITLIFGICTNVVNLIVFKRMGFKNTVTILFFALSLSDLIFLVLHLCSILGSDIILLSKEIPTLDDINLKEADLQFVLIWYASIPYDISALTIVFISVQRGLCVVLPLQFKTLVTKRRTLIILIFIWVFVISTCIPVLSTIGLGHLQHTPTNWTMSLFFTSKFQVFADAHSWLYRTVLPPVIQLTLLLSLATLTSSLIASAKFRNSSSSNAPKNEKSVSSKAENATKKQHGKELQVVKSVTLVALLFLLCNLPGMILFYVVKAVPDFKLGGVYEKLFFLCYRIRNEVEFLNASVNVFIYYKFNSKFRDTARRLFSRKQPVTTGTDKVVE